uniref:Uncharacterized protein n=1 Tax=Anguilla anguilla TaxID=7936 RepID=A0A0E9VRH8_ANGAN
MTRVCCYRAIQYLFRER